MSKYIKTNETTDISKVEEALKAGYEKAEEIAKAEAEDELEQIKHYKATSYEDLVKEAEEKIKNTYEKIINKAKENPEIADERIEDELDATLDIKDPRKRREEVRKAMENLSAEERFQMYCEIRNREQTETLKAKKEFILKRDILFDLMTEEQIQQYINLIYIARLKDQILWAKEEVLYDANIAPKVFGKEEKDGSRDNRMWEVEEDARKIVYVEEMNARNKMDKYDIIDKIKTGLGYLTGASILGLGAGGVSSLIAELAGNSDLSMNLFKASPLFIAAILACFGVPTIKEFIKNKQAIAEAKKLGLYDAIIERYQADKDAIRYRNQLEEIHDVEAKMGGMAI